MTTKDGRPTGRHDDEVPEPLTETERPSMRIGHTAVGGVPRFPDDKEPLSEGDGV